MLAYTTYSEAGGVGKSTLASALGESHAEHGYDVLAVDMDPQDGSLTHLLGVDAPRDDGSADNIVRHMIDRPKGDLDDLVLDTGYGIDLIPSHNMLERLEELLGRATAMADDLDEEFEPTDRLRQVVLDAKMHERYDVLIVDPPATAGPHLYNAVSATRSLVIPVEPSGKGEQSVIGLEDLVAGLEDRLGMEVGVLATVPNGVKPRVRDQQRYLEKLEDRGYEAHVVIGERTSLFEGCWAEQCPPGHYIENHRDRKRDHEMETLAKIHDLAGRIEIEGGAS